jgi:toxin-antitoxin system PIN domain toxin
VFVADTNVLVYAANRHAAGHQKCRDLLRLWRDQATPWHLTWGIVYEFLRVATHPNVFQKPWPVNDAWNFIQAVLASPSLSVLQETERHQQVANEVFQQFPLIAGNLIFDARTAILMREHGVRQIYTRDTAFHQFPFLQVIDPLR